MVSKVHILGWKAQGLRCPDHEINCCTVDDKHFPITLIQMPNGTGKTTTLSLLRAALSGAADGDRWSQDIVQEFKKKDAHNNDGLFELRLKINDNRMTITMEFDFETNRISYKTTWGSGQESGFRPPSELRRFMDPKFVDFYVFDGELAANLLDPNSTRAEIAIESLFQIHLLAKMKDKVSEYWDEEAQDDTAKEERGLKRRKNNLDKWRSRLTQLKTEKEKLKGRDRETKKQLLFWEEKYEREIQKHREQERIFHEKKEAVNNLTDKIEEHQKIVLDEMRNPHALSPVFANKIFDLRNGLDKAQLPESAAREFFEDIAEEEVCICGRELNEQTRQIILNHSQQYLGSDDVGLLNAIKSTVSDAVSESREKPSEDLAESIQKLSLHVANLQSAKNEFDDLKVEFAQSNPDVKQANDEIDRLKQEARNIEEKLKHFDGKDEKFQLNKIGKENPERIWAIKTVEDAIDKLEEQVGVITKTLLLKQKRDILMKILDSAHDKAREIITKEICENTNQKITSLMPDNKIQIEKIERCLKLQDRSRGSEGETLSVGYAFLSTLFSRADQHQLPFVVDSPANPIDFDIRTSIGSLIPHLTEQFIAFMISSERERFLDAMKKIDGMKIQYLTLFRKDVSHLTEKAMVNPKEAIESVDGLLVKDEYFFEEFQLEEEDS